MNTITGTFHAGLKPFRFYLLACLAAMLTPSLLSGQDYKFITGRINDAATGKPLPLASIVLLETTLSNVTNADGVFTLKIPSGMAHADSIRINYLGYKGLTVPVTDFETKKLRTVRLEPDPINLSGVTVRPEDALALFNAAFSSEKIRNNYSPVPRGFTGFYREIIKKGNQYLTLNEAVLDISKASYTNNSSDFIAIYKGRGNQNVKAADTLFLQLQGGPLSTMYLDLAKYNFAGCDLLSAPVYYNFWMSPGVYKDGKNIYVLNFNQKDSVTDVLFRGKLYIESESLALIRAEFSMNVEDNPLAWKEFVKRKPDKLNLGVEYANYTINYKQYGSRWYYDYGRIDLKFNARYKGKLLGNKFTIVSELAVTDIDNKAALKIEGQKRIRPRDIMSAKVNDFTNGDFWESYNIIEPDESIENIISKIIKQLRKRDR